MALIFAGIYFIKEYWENKVIFPEGGSYPLEFIAYTVPAYILVWLFSVYLSGGYDRPIRLIKIFQGIALGTVFILVVYALLSESYRFSRAIIILGAVWGFSSMILLLLSFLYIWSIAEWNFCGKRFLSEMSIKRLAHSGRPISCSVDSKCSIYHI